MCRLIDHDYHSQIDQFETALHSLGGWLTSATLSLDSIIDQPYHFAAGRPIPSLCSNPLA